MVISLLLWVLTGEYNLQTMRETILHIFNQPVPPPKKAGGANRLIHWLARAQSRAGHEVYVAAPGGRYADGYVKLAVPERYSWSDIEAVLPSGLTAIEHHGGGDESVQTFLDRMDIPILRMEHGVGQGFSPRKQTVYLSRRHAALHGGDVFVYNGVPVDDYIFERKKSDFFLFLAKVKRSKKGVADAIEIARKAGVRLLIAGGHRLESPHTWFRWHPRIYPVGIVDGDYKLKLLSQARALVVPIKWEEPFGLTMIEAMASGTPVIAYRRGAVPEIVAHGVTGFVCDTQEQMIQSLSKCATIDPARCRQRVMELFTDNLMAQGHVNLIREIRSDRRW
jgi:glycosyltransferase involved in cell wall biosynthesis